SLLSALSRVWGKSIGRPCGPLAGDGGSASKTVQGLLAIGCISGYFFFSSSVGCQLRPKGGPKSAQVLSSLAMSVVVNLASSDAQAATGGVVNAVLPKFTSIRPLYWLNSVCQVLSRSVGRQTMLAGSALTAGIVSRRTSRSL